MNGKAKVAMFMAVLVLIVPALACGESNAGTVVGTTVPSATVAPAVLQLNKIGDVVQVQGQTITLNSAQVSAGVLTANFTIANTGNASINVSSLLSFTAKDSDGTKLAPDFGCGTSSLDGTIMPGDKLRGDICWNTTSASPFRIYYEANIFGSGAVVWQIPQ